MLWSIIGPSRKHEFIARHFVFLQFERTPMTRSMENNVDPSEVEIQWLEAFGLHSKHWTRSVHESDTNMRLLLLPVDLNQTHCLHVSAPSEPPSKCYMVQEKDVCAIILARATLLLHLHTKYNEFINFDMLKYWPLMKKVQRRLRRKQAEEDL